MKSSRLSHIFLGLQFIGLAGYSLYLSSQLGWWAVPFSALFSLWLASAGLMSVAYSTWPDRFPRLYALEKPGWKLRLRHVEAVAQQLKDLGFQEIGVKVEGSLLISIPTREFWHPEHRTFASLSAQMFTPKVTFISKGDDGTILYSGRSLEGRQRTLVSQRLEDSSPREQLEFHLRGIRDNELAPTLPPGERNLFQSDLGPTAEQLLEWRLKMTREWYIASFGTDAQWEAWRTMHAPPEVAQDSPGS